MYAGKKYSFDVNQNLPFQVKSAGAIPGSTKMRLDALHVNIQMEWILMNLVFLGLNLILKK